METSVSMKTVDMSGKKNTTTLSYVNPNASNDLLKTYAEKLASLTSDTYNGATKIEKTDLDETTPTKPQRTVYFEHNEDTLQSPATFSYANLQAEDPSEYTDLFNLEWSGTVDERQVKISFDITGGLDVDYSQQPNTTASVSTGLTFNLAKGYETGTGAQGSYNAIHFYIPGDDTYQETEAVLSIVGGEG